MKRLLFTLCVLFSMSAMGDTRTKRAIFNFSNPESLTPSVTRSESAGGATYITGKTFQSTDGFITVSFDNTLTNPRSNIEIVTSGDRSSCYLTFHRNAYMIIKSINKNDTHPIITNILIPGSDNLGGLALTDTGTPSLIGMLDMSEDQMWYEWSAQGSTVRTVTFQNQSPSSPALHALVVSYEVPRDVLSESSYSYIGQESKSILSSFDGIQIEFPDNMTLTNDANISLSDGTPLVPSVNGKVVTIAPTKSITAEGQYTLTIGAGSFADASDYRNAELKYTFTIQKPFTFAISPAPGEVEAEELTSITLTFDGIVADVNQTMPVDLYDKNDLTQYVRRGYADFDGNSKVKITFKNSAVIDKNGIYTLIIPAGLVTSNANRKNIRTTCDYNIGNIATAEERNVALSFLNRTGIGYPSANATERTRLASLLSSSSPKADELSRALSNYLTTTSIEMPDNGYYYISAVSSNAERRYLTCDLNVGSVKLTPNSSEAMPLKVVRQANGGYTFQVTNGLYLQLPGASDVSLSLAANPLTLEKLFFDGIDTEAALGLFCISDASKTYALASIEKQDFVTSPLIPLSIFSPTLTNGFAFEAVPESAIPVPDVTYTLSPEPNSSMPLLTSVTVSFLTSAAVSLADASKVVLQHSDGSTVRPNSIKRVEGSANTYNLKFSDVKAGVHTLIIGKGGFTYPYTTDNGATINASVQTIQARYTVTTGDDFQYDFTSIYSIYFKEYINQDTPVKDTYLNHLTFYSNDTEIGVSPQEVLIVQFDTNKEVARGHFVKVDADESIPGAKGIIKLQLNDTIPEGSLPAGRYSYVIQQGTFGDANFGEYWDDPAKFLASGRTKADCHANLYGYYILTVDNQRAEQGNTPEPVDDVPSAEVLAKARQLLLNSGPGYPAATSSSRSALQRYVNAEKGSDDVYRSLMNDFIKETDVELPSEGKYYTIAGVSADGSAAYVKYNAGLLSLTKDASQAGIFKASGATILQTLDGKYMGVLTVSSLSETYNASHNLLLERLHVSGVADSLTFGLLSMTGFVNNFNVSARVNTMVPSITTAIGVPLTFTDTETSGFRFIRVDEQDIPAPPLSYALDPSSGSALESLTSLTLQVSGGADIALVNSNLISLTGNGMTAHPVVQSLGESTFLLNFDSTVLGGGDYTLTINPGAFSYTYLGRTIESQIYTATYNIIQHPSESILQIAENMLDQKGIGHPSDSCATRDALRQLVESGIGSDRTFINAMLNFQAETDVELPHAGHFYRLGMRNVDFTIKYLSYDNGVVGLTDNLSDAACFKVGTSTDGSLSFQTFDGKYLHSGSGLCVDAAESFFTAARLIVDGLENSVTYGRLSLSNADGFVTADVSMATILNARQSPELTDNITSSFLFAEIDKADIKMPDLALTVSPSTGSVQRLDTIEVRFNTSSIVQLADPTKVVLRDLSENVIEPKEAIKQQDVNVYTLSFLNLNATYYVLTIGSGAFTVEFFGEQTPIKETTLRYQVQEVPAFVSGYNKDVDLTWVENPENEYIMDSELNNFTLVSNAPLSLNPNKYVIIRDFLSDKEVGRGHLAEAASAEARGNVPADKYVYSLVLEQPIAEGSLSADIYKYIIEAETFGDDNYGRYLTDQMSIAKADCHVNDQLIYWANVDNEKASVLAVEHSVSPSSGVVEVLNKVIITFNTDEKITLKNSSLLTLTNTTATIIAKDVKVIGENSFELTFDDLLNGDYVLTVGTGAFMVNHRNRERKVEGFKLNYNLIKTGIREVGADADDAPVYDVHGRKVVGQLKKGQVYVKNGKKFIKK